MDLLVRVIWQIATLQRGPQVLPASSLLLWLALGAHWLSGVALAAFSLPFGSALLSALVGTLVMAGLVHALLVLHRRPARFVQTLTALAACETLLGVIGIPVVAGFAVEGTMREVASLIALLMLVWNIAIAGHIFRHAVEVSRGVSLLFAIGYTLIAISLSNAIVPAAN